MPTKRKVIICYIQNWKYNALHVCMYTGMYFSSYWQYHAVNILLVIIRVTVNKQNISVYKGYLNIYDPSIDPSMIISHACIGASVL